MTTINDIHDLVELLQNHPDWAETLRNLILTRELQGLPQTLARALQDWAETNQAVAQLMPATQHRWPATGSHKVPPLFSTERPSDLRATNPEFKNVNRRLQEAVIHQVSISWHRYLKAKNKGDKPRYDTRMNLLAMASGKA